VTGADGSIGGPACSCSQANAWRYRWSLLSLPTQLALLFPCPGRSGRIIAFRGKSGWLAMHAPLVLPRSPSSWSGSQKASQLSSACSQRNASSHCLRLRSPLLGKARFSSPKGTFWLLFFTRASVSALVCSFRFLSLSFSETSAPPAVTGSAFILSALFSSSQPRCAIRGSCLRSLSPLMGKRPAVRVIVGRARPPSKW